MSFLDRVEYEIMFQKQELHKASRNYNRKTHWTLHRKQRADGRELFYYRKLGSNKLYYINKKNYEIMATLCQNEFNALKQHICKENIWLLETLLSKYQDIHSTELFSRLPKAYKCGLDFLLSEKSKCFISQDAILYGFENIQSQSGKQTYQEGLRQSTSFGLKVRSKGEALIAESLHAANINFKYEQKLTLRDQNKSEISLYPDFTIELPCKTIYWEHKGMLNDEEYLKRDMVKTQLYFINDIYQPNNLIVTCDGPDGSTDMSSIRQIIDAIIKPQL